MGNQASRHIAVTRRAVVASRPVRASVKAPARSNPYGDIHFGNYHALVIGNNDYQDLTDLLTDP